MKTFTIILIIANLFPMFITLFNKPEIFLGLPLIFFYMIVISIFIIVLTVTYYKKR